MQDVTPFKELSADIAKQYTSTFWSDFKSVIGIDNKNLTPYEELIRGEFAPGDFIRRMISGTTSLGKTATLFGSYALGGGLVGGTITATISNAAWNMTGLGKIGDYFKQKAFVESIGQIIGRGTGQTLSGHGFGSTDVKGVQSFLSDAATRNNTSIDEVQKMVVKYINEGLFSNTQNMEQFKRQFGQLTKNVKDIISTLGATQEEAISIMAEFNRSGITPGTGLTTALTTAQLMSRRTGISASTFMASGVQTAQAFQGTGLSGIAGFNLGISNRAAIEAGIVSGRIPQNTIWQLGGADNASFALSQQHAQFLNTPIGNILLRSAMKPGGDLDVSGLTPSARMINHLSRAVANMSGGGYLDYLAYQDQLKSEFLAKGSDFVNSQIFMNLVETARLSGYDVNKMGISQLKGFAMATGQVANGAMFDVMAGSIMSARPGGTAVEREVKRRLQSRERRRYMRSGGLLDNIRYGIGRAGAVTTDWITEPVSDITDEILYRVDETVQRFDEWADQIKYGTVKYSITERNIKDIGEIIAGSGMDNISQDLMSGIHSGSIFSSSGTGKFISKLIRTGVINREEVGARSLDEVFRNNYRQLKEGGWLKAMGVEDLEVEDGRTFGQAGRGLRITPEQKISLLQKLPDYERAGFYKDVGVLKGGRGTEEYLVIQDSGKLSDSIQRTNQIVRYAKEFGSADIDKIIRMPITAETKDGPVTLEFDDIVNRLSIQSDRDIRRFKRQPPEAQLRLLAKAANIEESNLDNKDVVLSLIAAGKRTRLEVDTNILKEIDLEMNADRVKSMLKSKHESLKDMVSGIEAGIGGIRKKTEEYLKDENVQSGLRKWKKIMDRRDKYGLLTNEDRRELQAIEYELSQRAPDAKSQEEMEKLFLDTNRSKTYSAISDRFKSGGSFEKEMVLATNAVLTNALSMFEGSEVRPLSNLYSRTMGGGLDVAEMLREKRGISIQDLGKAILPEISSDKITAEDLLTRGTDREAFISYALMSPKELLKVDKDIRGRIEKSIRDAVGVESIGGENIRAAAFQAAGKHVTDTGVQYAGGSGMHDAYSQSQADLNRQMVETLRVMYNKLIEMSDKSEKKWWQGNY
ncbi:MAG: hypothetical protein WCY30_05800 [Candidatus Neomarinimicrobiota bacterium]|jgi:hypothetical protein